jgi:hypothetical protein
MLDFDERSASESLHSAHRVDRIPLRSVSAAAYTVAHAVARPQLVVTPCGDKFVAAEIAAKKIGSWSA